MIEKIKVGSCTELLDRGLLGRLSIRSIDLPVEQPEQLSPCQGRSLGLGQQQIYQRQTDQLKEATPSPHQPSVLPADRGKWSASVLTTEGDSGLCFGGQCILDLEAQPA